MDQHVQTSCLTSWNQALLLHKDTRGAEVCLLAARNQHSKTDNLGLAARESYFLSAKASGSPTRWRIMQQIYKFLLIRGQSKCTLGLRSTSEWNLTINHSGISKLEIQFWEFLEDSHQGVTISRQKRFCITAGFSSTLVGQAATARSFSNYKRCVCVWYVSTCTCAPQGLERGVGSQCLQCLKLSKEDIIYEAR